MTSPLRVLIVEDTPIAQVVVKVQMTKQGCEVELAENGHVALEKAMSNRYDVILMDIGLGEGPDGFEVTRQIRAQSGPNQKTPIIAVTSHGGDDYIEKAKSVGMEEYLNKPFTPDDAKKIVDYLKNEFNLGS